MKWNFPISRKLIRVYKELGFIKFMLWFILIWLGLKIIVFNVFGILFFDMEPFPIIGGILEGLKGSLNYLLN